LPLLAKLSLKQNKIAKQYLLDTIKDHNIFDKNFNIVFKSSANFVLTKLKDITAKEFQDKLAVYNILIRDCSNFDFLDQNHVRIAVKNLNNMKRFDEVLKKIVF
jgi:threonine-phosphate decarboxylase